MLWRAQHEWEREIFLEFFACFGEISNKEEDCTTIRYISTKYLHLHLARAVPRAGVVDKWPSLLPASGFPLRMH
jgi:hypothetical protein